MTLGFWGSVLLRLLVTKPAFGHDTDSVRESVLTRMDAGLVEIMSPPADPLRNVTSLATASTDPPRTMWGEIEHAWQCFVIGFVVFVTGFPIIFYNEQRMVKAWRLINSAVKSCITDVDPWSIDAAKDNCLVHVKGKSTGGTLEDVDFGIRIPNCAKLRREVEMYQWIETEKKEKERVRGRENEYVERKWYEYHKDWRGSLESSASFHDRSHYNPSSMPIVSNDWNAEVAESGRRPSGAAS